MIFFVKFRFFNSTSYLISISPWSCPMINNHLSQLWRICTRLCMFRIISSDGSRAGGYKRSEWSPDSQECEILPCLAAVKLPIKPKVNRKTWPFKYNILFILFSCITTYNSNVWMFWSSVSQGSLKKKDKPRSFGFRLVT